ncbi:MAG: hypothetical protein OHK0048_02140 [Rhodoferax sp.]
MNLSNADAVVFSLQLYALAAGIALAVAGLIKALVWGFTRAQAQPTAPAALPVGEVCPLPDAIPDADVAAIAAALTVLMGPHRVLHIVERRAAWTLEGRAAQHSAHDAFPARGHYGP